MPGKSQAICLFGIFAGFFLYCGEKPALSPEQAELKQGQALYRSLCTACHNISPELAGSIGPAVAGASLELLTAKVLHGTYPEGYTPARPTKMMTRIPLTEADLKALAAFLAKK